MKNVKISTLVRVALLILALGNLICAAVGVVPEEFVADSEIYRVGSVVVTVVMSVVAAWKNNSFTPEAIEADDFLHSLLDAKKSGTTTTASTTPTEEANTKAPEVATTTEESTADENANTSSEETIKQ